MIIKNFEAFSEFMYKAADKLDTGEGMVQHGDFTLTLVEKFLRNHCAMDVSYSIRSLDLYNTYKQWCINSNVFVLSHKKFSQVLIEHGAISERRTSGRWWLGLRLKEG